MSTPAVALDAAPAARAVYDLLPSSHRAEYDRWVGEAVGPETRARRAAQALERLTAARFGRRPGAAAPPSFPGS